MEGRISVAMVTRDYPPKSGGISTHVHALVTQLRRLGVQVDTFVGYSDLRTILTPVIMSLSRYDVVHVQSSPYALFVSKRPMVVTVHSPILEEGRYYRSANLLKMPLAYASERVSLGKANAVVAVSNASKDVLVERYGVDQRKISVIPNGVDLDQFVPGKRSQSSVSRVLICSRLDPRKNIEEAFLALSELKGLSFKLEVIGDGAERKKLESLSDELHLHADFRGEVKREDLHSSFAESDVFVSTSHSEGFGISVLEAMASGCAVVVSDIPAHRGFVSHLEDGLVYSSHADLVSCLRKVLTDRDLAQQLGAKARARAASFSWEGVARQTLRLYERLLPAR